MNTKTLIIWFLLLAVVVAVGAEVDNKRQGGRQVEDSLGRAVEATVEKDRDWNYEFDQRGRKEGGAWKGGGELEATYPQGFESEMSYPQGVESEMSYPQGWGGWGWGGPWGGWGRGWGGWGRGWGGWGRGWGWGGPGWGGGGGWGGWRRGRRV